MIKKLGIDEYDREVVEELFSVMHETGSDFTNTFRSLVDPDVEELVK